MIIAVLGAGQMGSGIAHVAALAGYSVHLYDVKQAIVSHAINGIEKNLSRQQTKGSITAEQAKAALDKIQIHHTLGAWLQQVDFIIEAILENHQLKQQLYAQLSDFAQPMAILASNTSSYTIEQLAKSYRYPAQCIGMHFMNPVPMMPLVEIVVSKQTSQAVVAATEQLAEAMGKTTIQSADKAGFIANRIFFPMINEAIYALDEGLASAADIDKAMTLGMKHPMGPLALADFIGLDTCLAILNTLYDGISQERYCPCPLLQTMVNDGCLGKKSGRGFYDYNQ